MKHLKKFETETAYNSYIGGVEAVLPNVSLVTENQIVHYNPIQQGHEYVDLGLPSGTLWATMNIGASSPEEYGNYYAWGELSGKSDYSWSTYRFGSASPFTKYDQDGLTTLELVDDVARTEWGGDWRMPTQADLQELIDNTTSVWDSAKSGRTFTSKTNGNSIFIPAAGRYNGTSSYSVGTYCYLWSSSLTPSNHDNALYLLFSSRDMDIYMDDRDRYYGFSVRGVIKP
jgi:uncharacterized protein (TIGR02145 family)